MARQNRSEIFNPHQVCVMHCINRTVRRAMLCGVDRFSGKSFEHRRQWVKDRLIFLAAQYGIDVLGYTVMGNHLHIILRNRPDIVRTWSDAEVARRIWYLFPKRKEDDGSAAEPRKHELQMLMASKKLLSQYRERLSDISWLMRQLAEYVARKANHEDKCTGRFWEGRFKSQPLLDDAAVFACAAYVDLNPVRAKIAETPEQSDFTSVQDRIVSEKVARKQSKSTRRKQRKTRRRDSFLSPVFLKRTSGPQANSEGTRASNKGFLSVPLRDYLKLLDWTGRQIVHRKRGHIPFHCRSILHRIGLNGETWCELVENFGQLFTRVAGRVESIADYGNHRSRGDPALLSG